MRAFCLLCALFALSVISHAVPQHPRAASRPVNSFTSTLQRCPLRSAGMEPMFDNEKMTKSAVYRIRGTFDIRFRIAHSDRRRELVRE